MMLVVAPSPPAVADASALRVAAYLAHEDAQGASKTVVVQVENVSKTEVAITRVSLGYGRSEIDSTGVRTVISPQASRVFEIEAPDGFLAGDAPVVVEYVGTAGRTDAIAVSIAAPSAAPPSPFWYPGLFTLVSAIVALVGVAIGAWLTHVTTRRREREKARLEWAKSRFDRDSKPYVAFLSQVGTHVNATLLEERFLTLRKEVAVPSRIVKEFEKACGVLRDRGSSQPEKRRSLERLHDEISKELEFPE
ncbi:hypothetical protein [Micromonospora sp. BL1]|uniref:hypothetical protein n=1 Tax=Micromonospora sp. BL1 TaxID=2478709 RepID=UPI0011C3EAD2|nr:hypothetical protein [Micromonospora sp. BL1]